MFIKVSLKVAGMGCEFFKKKIEVKERVDNILFYIIVKNSLERRERQAEGVE